MEKLIKRQFEDIRMIDYLRIINGYKDSNMFKQLDDSDERNWTYEDYYKDIKMCAFSLEEMLGDLKGKHIGILAQSGYGYLVLLAAIIFSRAVAVPLNNLESEINIFNAVKKSETVALIVDDDCYSFDNVKIIEKDNLFQNFKQEKALSDFVESEGEDPALIIFTSGTTSLSKGVVLSVNNLFENGKIIFPKEFMNIPKSLVNVSGYTNFPYYHVGGILLWLGLTEIGVTLCMSKEQKNVLHDLENKEIAYAIATPALLKLWLNSLKRGKRERLGALKCIFSGGAAIEPSVIKIFGENGIMIVPCYGITEAGGFVTFNYDVMNHIGSVGKPNEGTTITVVDGELCIDGWGNMKGYYHDQEETEKTLKDGIVYTGDMGYIDEQGFVYITGRKKNLIILSSGENVSPEEIENLLYSNSAIRECLVYAKNDRIFADIYAPDMNEDEVMIYIKELNKSLPLYKRLNHIEYKYDPLEKTASGKIKR